MSTCFLRPKPTPVASEANCPLQQVSTLGVCGPHAHAMKTDQTEINPMQMQQVADSLDNNTLMKNALLRWMRWKTSETKCWMSFAFFFFKGCEGRLRCWCACFGSGFTVCLRGTSEHRFELKLIQLTSGDEQVLRRHRRDAGLFACRRSPNLLHHHI